MSRLWLKAYPIGSTEGWTIEPAPHKREWMDATYKKVAYHCLPLVVANQVGWIVRCPANFTATWSGKMDNNAVKVVYAPDSAHLAHTAVSHFGSGVLTFHLPWLFRTSPGIGLLIRGPTNDIKDNAVPLDGLIETDWSPYSFTMNWKLVRRNVPVYFKKGDPVCMLQPFPLELLEQFDCSFEPYAAAPGNIQQGHKDFVDKRLAGNAVAAQGEYVPHRDYYTGRFPDGSPAHYPPGTPAPPPITGCPVHHHNVPPSTEPTSSPGEPGAAPAPAHRTKFQLKPFEDKTRPPV
ncbi:MAG TPA: DUF6065 family protein [Phycisphaerales bacterium]|nr:DUF6065 family protein [Phycisphaerales bacterium]